MKISKSKTVLLIVLTSLFVGAMTIISLSDIPKFNDFKSQVIGSDQYFFDQQGQLIHQLRKDLKKRKLQWVSFSSFNQDFIDILLFVEDQRFFNHWGVDLRSMIRALWATLKNERIQGASTLSMQVADLTRHEVLVGHKKIVKGQVINKLSQIFRALLIEWKWTKNEILETYLNLIHLKGEYQGVRTFSLAYFKKNPSSLNRQDALIISSLIRAPNQSQERLTQTVCAHAKRLQPPMDCLILKQKIKEFFLSDGSLNMNHLEIPHLAQRLVREKPDHTEFKTFIDSELQSQVYKILEKNLSSLQSSKVQDAAAIVIDNKTGQVLAYIGTIAKYSKAPHVDGVHSPRQAGSTLKPFFYSRAIDKKYITAASLIEDDKTVISWSGGLYRPTNYDQKFYGSVSVRDALASSLNIPAVKMIKMLGLSESYSVLTDLKFSDLKNPDRYGASLALGSIEVRLDELSNAYRAMANGGKLTPLIWTKEDSFNQSSTIMSEETAFIISDILSDPNARKIGFNWDSALETSFWTAVKTGTSKGLRDNWTVGYSSEYTVGVWAGNFSSSPMRGVSGVTAAAPSWNEIMTYLHRQKKSFRPGPPAGIVQKKIKYKGQLHSKTDYFIAGTEPHDELISQSSHKLYSIVFPAHGSRLMLDPHLNQKATDLLVTYKGGEDKKTVFVFLNDQNLGPLTQQFKLSQVKAGQYKLEFKDEAKEAVLASSQFEVH